jgi:chorismate synthase
LMGSTFGKNIKISVFGESHGEAIGVTIDGLPAGIKLSLEDIKDDMQRRSSNSNAASTQRKEADISNILSGFYNGYTTGSPLCAVIKNSDMHSNDYNELLNTPRPGHADYTAHIKYNGFADMRGGGHFSGRLTAPLVFAGAVARAFLKSQGVYVGAHILQIGNVLDKSFDPVCVSHDELISIKNKDLCVLNSESGDKMNAQILQAKEDETSIGGIIECAAVGVKVGVGDPLFDSVESYISHLLFSIPAVKGVEFGDGFEVSKSDGFNSNDAPFIESGEISFKTNHSGGILGGISNGMPIILRVAFKPTPSIAKMQHTVNLNTKTNEIIKIKGRHDTCIVPRAVVVVEAAVMIGLMDLML